MAVLQKGVLRNAFFCFCARLCLTAYAAPLRASMPDGIRRAMHRVTCERSVAGAFGAAEAFAERIERRAIAPKRDSEAAGAFAERIARRGLAPKRDSEAAGAYEIAPA